MLYKYHTEKATDIDLDLPDMPLKKAIKSGQQAALRSSPSLYSDDSCGGGGFNPFGANSSQEQRTKGSYDPDWADKLMEQYTPGLLANGAKFLISIDLIQQSIKAGDKILLFSQSLLSLDLIEKYLAEIQVCNSTEKWTRNRHYYRKWLKTFENKKKRKMKRQNFPLNYALIWKYLLGIL